MKITKISLTNFRSFKGTQTIELAPVTLLFGPNSVGKSSVLMALAYVQHILSKGHCSPERLDALGAKTIGGFRSLVYGHDLSKTIKIRIDYEVGNSIFEKYGSLAEEWARQIDVNHLQMPDFDGNIKSIGIELEISWSNQFQHAYVSNYCLWVNEVFFGRIRSGEDKKNTRIEELNTDHSLLIPINHNDWIDQHFGEGSDSYSLAPGQCGSFFEEALDQINPNRIGKTETMLTEFGTPNRCASISLGCFNGAIPLLNTAIVSNLNGQSPEELEDHINFLLIKEILSQAFVLPLDMLLEYLGKSVLIGPLRVMPDSNFVPNPYPVQCDWIDGSAAWDLLLRDPSKSDNARRLLDITSSWFSTTNKLNTGYEILNKSLSDGLPMEFYSTESERNLLNQRRLYFKEIRTNILLSANQLGTGISQVLPIVVAANSDELGLVSVEQPELHIHPRFQVELADVFLQNFNKRSFLIETHSEHLILRLLKRIRQTTDVDLPDGITATKNTDVSIVYLEPSAEGVIARRIHLDGDGEFIEHWPHGFFAERREELL